jgi:hypothetical protein
VKLGKKAPITDTRSLKLSAYLKSLPPAPMSINWDTKSTNVDILLNDQIGDCTIVTLANLIKCWTAENGNEAIVTEQDVLAAYQAVSGYVPSDPTTDNGAVMLTVMNYFRRTALAGYKADAFVTIDIHDREHFKQAIAHFGGAALGFSLPKSIQNQSRWAVTMGGTHGDPRIGSLGGHAVSAHAYKDEGGSNDGVMIRTWGQRVWVSWAFINAYCDEGFALVSKAWADSDGAPNGFPYDQLMNDVKAIAGITM